MSSRTIQVTDTGRGIPAEEQETIFLPFRQARTDDHRFEAGAGVGLAIASALIRLMDGTIDVDSEPGKGTTFTITLPLTLAILPSLMAEIDGDIFALPVESVVEIVVRHAQAARKP